MTTTTYSHAGGGLVRQTPGGGGRRITGVAQGQLTGGAAVADVGSVSGEAADGRAEAAVGRCAGEPVRRSVGVPLLRACFSAVLRRAVVGDADEGVRAPAEPLPTTVNDGQPLPTSASQGGSARA